jgi:aspartate carbamoyltransferase catalytic subunit
MDFRGRDVVSINDFTLEEINYILDVAEGMVPAAKGEEVLDLIPGKILAMMFYEPSTRTMLSFETAMKRIGGKVIGFSDVRATSSAKGETLADTIKMVEAYADVIVLRHDREGAARMAAEFSDIPVLNAGDGAGQHPTQTLLDLYTMRSELGYLRKKNIALVGDLKYGRTIHSLTYALAKFGANLHFIAPEGLQMPPEVVSHLEKRNASFEVHEDISEVMGEVDVLYVTRIQKERFPDIEEYHKVAGAFRIDTDSLAGAKKSMIIMHPLPRVDEISSDVDGTRHARYFQQAFNGVPVRMALLSLVLGVDVGVLK